MAAMITYSEAPQVEAIARELIETTHPHLDGVRIDYLFRDTAHVSGGKITYGSARKAQGLMAFMSKEEAPFFIIEIAQDRWENLPDTARVALVDHELCHCGVEITEDEDGVEEQKRLFIIKHDLEEFNDIVRRHGLWRSDVSEFAKALSELL